MRNISDKTVQGSVQRAIDNNQLFSLKHISQLKDLIRLNITVMVDPSSSQNYSYMSLIQYAIKQNKPDPLEYMLSVAIEADMKYENIIRSDFKYENNNLLFLAIDFNSNSCLETLINFFKKEKNFTVDVSDPFGESPLTRAIKLGNEEAIKILLNNNASLFYFDQSKNKLSTFMPLLCVFFYNREKEKLTHILDEVIKPCLEEQEKGKFSKAISDFSHMYFNDNFLKTDKNDGTSIDQLFKSKSLMEANSYILNYKYTPEDLDGPISTFQQQQSQQSRQSRPSNLSNPPENKSDDIRCHFCQKIIESGKGERTEDGFYICDSDECQSKYEEYCKNKDKK